ncbi:hypothetical protein F2P56_026393 [Juglans regia]|uniref:Uncharacterized protein n=1 Tax=Juglans regia TaxID=51240 RepID=A0A833T1Z3_JUGRE|nr:hypothetical protein F2P56_026393 [Juglans regia]
MRGVVCLDEYYQDTESGLFGCPTTLRDSPVLDLYLPLCNAISCLSLSLCVCNVVREPDELGIESLHRDSLLPHRTRAPCSIPSSLNDFYITGFWQGILSEEDLIPQPVPLESHIFLITINHPWPKPHYVPANRSLGFESNNTQDFIPPHYSLRGLKRDPLRARVAAATACKPSARQQWPPSPNLATHTATSVPPCPETSRDNSTPPPAITVDSRPSSAAKARRNSNGRGEASASLPR